MDSFVAFLFSRRRSRVLAVIAVPFFIAVFFANVIVAHLSQSSDSIAVTDLTGRQESPVVGSVAGTFSATEPARNLTALSAPRATEAPTPTPERSTRKNTYTIAVFGDSMVDTMGERLEYLEGALKEKYPKTSFKLYNYGTGSQNVDEGLARFSKEFSYQTRSYPPLTVLSPDIIILGSFSYNPFSPYDRNHHWLSLAKLIQEAKRTGADVYVLAEIAPLRSDFGKGPNGVNWDQVTAFEHSGRIIEQLENTIGLAKNENVILINTFEKSVVNNRREGKKEYVNPSDGIHPSVKGHEFIAKEIADSLVLDY